MTMSTKSKIAWVVPLVVGIAIGVAITGKLGLDHAALAQSQSQDNLPRGRTAAAIADGQYPATYFPNTEVLGPAEMRTVCRPSAPVALR